MCFVSIIAVSAISCEDDGDGEEEEINYLSKSISGTSWSASDNFTIDGTSYTDTAKISFTSSAVIITAYDAEFDENISEEGTYTVTKNTVFMDFGGDIGVITGNSTGSTLTTDKPIIEMTVFTKG